LSAEKLKKVKLLSNIAVKLLETKPTAASIEQVREWEQDVHGHLVPDYTMHDAEVITDGGC
jgi:hypothetical protein